MKKGRYVAVPTTFDAGGEADFLFRVYTENSMNFKELVHEIPKAPWYNCCATQPKLVTHIKVLRAVGLERQDTAGGADPYCVIKCEGQRVVVKTCKNTTSPEW